ncbi:hypothetical protein O205_14160 [Bacillus amyloliquefaciens EGD-AQ14]|nr:hypothetical protein BAMY6614_05785 [Bacillus amyloliquefaciens UMAF6614]ERH51528.1 hypothetical protein O205_14160 [Bacillus amyloliquefaciens EGD-AQ14]
MFPAVFFFARPDSDSGGKQKKTPQVKTRSVLI